MKPYRRWFQYSLRSFLILLTVFAVWLGVVVNRAREQREAVKAIEALGGLVFYDWELVSSARPRMNGDDLFHNVELVIYGYSERENLLQLIPHLQRVRGLKTLIVADAVSEATLNQLRASIPECYVGPL